MKKIVYIFMLILESAAIIGAYIIHYFTKRKLGMVRYLNYKNMTWERAYPVDTLKTVCVIIVPVLTVLILLLFLKRRKEVTRLTGIMNICMIALTVLYGGYTLMNSTDSKTDYYFISMLFLFAAVIQILKTGFAVLTAKGREEGK